MDSGHVGFPMPRTVKVGYLSEVTYEVIQRVLIEAYRLHRADPQYLFLSPKSLSTFQATIPRYAMMYMMNVPVPGLHATVNPATGKVVDVIPLPHFDDSTVILGFLDD